MNKIKETRILILIGILLFLALPIASASIDIIDMGTRYDCIDHYGYIDYQANSNSSGAISVFIDDSLVKTKALDMKIRYLFGFRCNPIKTFEFTLNESEGNHSILAVIISDNVTAERMFGYFAEDWVVPVDEEEEIIEEWMVCP